MDGRLSPRYSSFPFCISVPHRAVPSVNCSQLSRLNFKAAKCPGKCFRRANKDNHFSSPNLRPVMRTDILSHAKRVKY